MTEAPAFGASEEVCAEVNAVGKLKSRQTRSANFARKEILR